MRPHRRPPPLDQRTLEALALRYVERFATTRGKLSDYLRRKIRERGWDGPVADVTALADRFAGLGYIDDRAFADAKAAALTRRGFGGRRVAMTLHAARVEAEDAAPALEQAAHAARDSAIAFARRRRIGPFAAAAPDEAARRRQFAAMMRAGHAFDLVREILGSTPDALAEDQCLKDEDD